MSAAPGAQARIEQAKPTWFFEQPNGTIIAVQEEEAWRIYTARNQVVGQRQYPLKIVGVGKGEIYQQAVKEAIEIKKTGRLLPCEPSPIQTPIQKNEDEVVTVTTYACKNCEATWAQNQPIPTCLNSPTVEQQSQARLHKGYFDELEEARKTIRAPRNFDTITHNNRPTSVSDVQNGII